MSGSRARKNPKSSPYILPFTSLVISVLIKYATVVLIPIYLLLLYQQVTAKKVQREKIWLFCSFALYLVLFLAPLREEIYSWYFIWPFTFVVLTQNNFLKSLSVAFSCGLLFRVTPFIYTGQWFGITTYIKKIVTFVPLLVAFLTYPIYKKLLK